MSTLSTHVLDAVRGAPAVAVAVTLSAADATELATGTTDSDGRIGGLGDALGPGTYHLTFATGRYFEGQRVSAFFPEVRITFTVAEERHYHVSLLLSPFAYSTYRGS